MNASDIIKNRQKQTLYTAYYHPTVYQSTTISTLTPISSYTTGYNSYSSTTNTVYTYASQPTFMTYELMNDVKNGKDLCTSTCSTKLSWTNMVSTSVLNFSTNYSTITIPVGYNITSTIVQASKGPVICSLVDYYQGTNMDRTVNTNY